MVLDRYRPRREWFAHAPDGIHGIAHVARVLVWAEWLADALEAVGEGVDREVVRCAAVVHDVARVDDGRDPDHGRRAAARVAGHTRLLPVALTAAQVEAVRYCCEWHVPSDAECPVMTAELRCLKDADGLDRVRIYDLNPKYLRTEPARRLVARAQELLEQSEGREGREGGPWERVRAAALAMELWR